MEKKIPLVSIITPLYNAERYILETANSVFSQTLVDFEWLIVNDCSKDKSLEIVNDLGKKDSRIKVLDLNKNSGPIIARNNALEVAQGRFIAFLDADDIWMPQKLELQLNLMLEQNVVLSYTGFKKITKDGDLKNNKMMNVPLLSTYHSILKSDCIVASSAVYDTDITGNIKQDVDSLLGKDDFDFFLMILKSYGNAVGVNQELTHLRVFKESLTGNKLKSAKKQWVFYREYLKLNTLQSCYNFVFYAIKGLIKYIK